MSRAHTIAMRDRGKPLHVDTEQAGERSRLNLADLRKALGHVRHRAVMLAELLTDGCRQGGSDVTVFGEGDRESLGVGGTGCGFCHPISVAHLAPGHSRLSEARYSIGPRRGCQKFQRLDSDVVVGGVEHRTPGVGQHKILGRAAATAGTIDALFPRLNMASCEQDVEVPTNRCWGQPQPLRQLRSS